MIRTCLFDLGNVLVRFCHDRMWRQIAEVVGSDDHEVARRLKGHQILTDIDTGHTTVADIANYLSDSFGCALPLDALTLAIADIFTPVPDMVALAHEVAERGHRLVLLSNTCVPHIDWLRTAPQHAELSRLLDRFDALVLSYEVAAVKPSAAIYQAALDQINCEPGECFYTDDIAEYVAAGRSHGLDAEQFVGIDELRRHLTSRGVLG
ncbi:MAG: HAD family phosphatase [Planctomycetaceae bacterium]